ncbi:MAG: GNAT family N-acetyltransferase [Candidatus Hodarchaeota archaeon]
MTTFKDLAFEPASEADILPLTTVMIRAFDDDAQRNLGAPRDHPPGYESGAWLREWLSKGIVYKIVKNESIIGGFLILLNVPRKRWNYIGSIFVDLPFQNQAVGSRILQFIEHTFPADRWQTMTQAWAKRNHYFYEKNGYIKVKEFIDKTTEHRIYVYEKVPE